MTTILIALHVLVSMALILIVLLQTGKGAQLGAAFGGASQTVFGSRGPTGFLGKLTTAAAVIFMLTSLTLAYLSAKRAGVTAVREPAKQERSAPAPTPPQVPQPGSQAPGPPSP